MTLDGRAVGRRCAPRHQLGGQVDQRPTARVRLLTMQRAVLDAGIGGDAQGLRVVVGVWPGQLDHQREQLGVIGHQPTHVQQVLAPYRPMGTVGIHGEHGPDPVGVSFVERLGHRMAGVHISVDVVLVRRQRIGGPTRRGGQRRRQQLLLGVAPGPAQPVIHDLASLPWLRVDEDPVAGGGHTHAVGHGHDGLDPLLCQRQVLGLALALGVQRDAEQRAVVLQRPQPLGELARAIGIQLRRPLQEPWVQLVDGPAGLVRLTVGPVSAGLGHDAPHRVRCDGVLGVGGGGQEEEEEEGEGEHGVAPGRPCGSCCDPGAARGRGARVPRAGPAGRREEGLSQAPGSRPRPSRASMSAGRGGARWARRPAGRPPGGHVLA